jgi:hypothetical protein
VSSGPCQHVVPVPTIHVAHAGIQHVAWRRKRRGLTFATDAASFAHEDVRMVRSGPRKYGPTKEALRSQMPASGIPTS